MKKRHSAEQIVVKLRQADVELGTGLKVPEGCKQWGISEQTYCRWRIRLAARVTVDMYPKESAHQPPHAGDAVIFDPAGQTVAATQADEIRDEMFVAPIDANLLADARSQPNYTFKAGRAEVFGKLVDNGF